MRPQIERRRLLRKSDQLEEIVVTANKRSERAQTVPIAVTAISGHQALSSGVTDTVSLANAVPGLRVDRAPGSSIPYLRGVGNAAGSIGSEPSVSLYVDDVYTPAAGAFFGNATFAEGERTVMNMGFDCIETQGAHGYLKPELRDISRDWGFQ